MWSKRAGAKSHVSLQWWLAHSSILGVPPGCNKTPWPFFGVKFKSIFIFYMPWQSEHCQCQGKTVCDISSSLGLLFSSAVVEGAGVVFRCANGFSLSVWSLQRLMVSAELQVIPWRLFKNLCFSTDFNQMRKALSRHGNETLHLGFPSISVHPWCLRYFMILNFSFLSHYG